MRLRDDRSSETEVRRVGLPHCGRAPRLAVLAKGFLTAQGPLFLSNKITMRHCFLIIEANLNFGGEKGNKIFP